MDDNKSTLYDQIVNNIPLYFKKIFSVIGAVIFTASLVYFLYSSAILYNLAFYDEIGYPYFAGSIDLWVFYSVHPFLLIEVLLSILYVIGFSIFGIIGLINPNKNKLYQYIIPNFLIALIVFVFAFASKEYGLWLYILFVVVYIAIMSITMYFGDKYKKNNQSEVKDKFVLFGVLFITMPLILLFPVVSIYSFNFYNADLYGRENGKILLKSIKNNEYINNKGTALIKSSEEYVYSLSCGESSCLVIRKAENDELLFETIDRKNLIFRKK